MHARRAFVTGFVSGARQDGIWHKRAGRMGGLTLATPAKARGWVDMRS